MLRAALVALGVLSLSAVAAAQSTTSSTPAKAAHVTPGQAARPRVRPTSPGGYPGGYPSHSHSGGNYQPVIVINPNDYVSPAPKHNVPLNQTHADQYPGQQTFSSQSTDNH
jgi:hypothetical protein